jgi:hypothetical protein
MRFTAALGLVAILAVALAGQPDGTPVISIPVLVTEGRRVSSPHSIRKISRFLKIKRNR